MTQRHKSNPKVDSAGLEKLRLDKWLWAARFFKNRGMATDEINGGKVHVNGERSKPARAIKAGDTLKITKGIYTWEVIVVSLTDKRRTAEQAQALYVELESSEVARKLLSDERRLHIMAPSPKNRPDKRDRRRLKEVRERGGQ
jgi:ribosome-associated heat shock protein Hsp15